MNVFPACPDRGTIILFRTYRSCNSTILGVNGKEASIEQGRLSCLEAVLHYGYQYVSISMSSLSMKVQKQLPLPSGQSSMKGPFHGLCLRGLEFSLSVLEVYGLGKRIHHRILYYPDLDRPPATKDAWVRVAWGLRRLSLLDEGHAI